MTDALRVLFIDNFDSFSFNLVDELRRRGARVDVWRNDLAPERALELALAMAPPRLIVLSPGPGRPEDAGCCQSLVRMAAGRVPLFGVCLGLQAIVQSFGGEVGPAGEVVHGKAVWIDHEGDGVLAGLPNPLVVGRYHSLVACRIPPELTVTASCPVGRAWRQERGGPPEGVVGGANAGLGAELSARLTMAVAHRELPVAAVQFHPESILTPHGGQLLATTMRWAGAWVGTREVDHA